MVEVGGDMAQQGRAHGFERVLVGERLDQPARRIADADFCDQFVPQRVGALGENLLRASGGGVALLLARRQLEQFLGVIEGMVDAEHVEAGEP